jgi:hypothetical protein
MKYHYIYNYHELLGCIKVKIQIYGTFLKVKTDTQKEEDMIDIVNLPYQSFPFDHF